MQKVQFTPQFDDGNGWYNMLPPAPAARVLEGDQKANWLVIGAGYTGLSAARRLAEHFPEQRIALVEADRVGRGTAGRNAGFAIDVPFLQESQGDLERGRRIFSLHRAGVAELDRLITEHSIDCQWSRRGKYMVAVGDGTQQALQQTQDFLLAVGAQSEVLGREALKERLGTGRYRMGLYSPGTCLMNPAALTRGLAASLPENVDLYEDSPITETRFDSRTLAKTTRGSIEASGVILATNGFSETFGVAQHQLFNLMSFASITRPLAPEQTELLGGTEDWGIHPVGIAGATIRRTQDNRIWHRTGFIHPHKNRSSESLLRRFRQRHIKDFKARFPQLCELDFEHTYGGLLCMSRNSEPLFQRLADNAFLVGCQNGIGVAKGTIHGRLVADWVAGADSELLDFARAYGKPSRLPREPFLGWGISSRLRLEAWKGRKE
jgi:glycine/D-amino acid oxidase-like deaminating enzyme